MNFITSKGLNYRTFSRFKCFLTPYRTRNMKIQNFSSRNRQKNRSIIVTQVDESRVFEKERCNPLAKTRLVWRVKMNFNFNKSLNNGAFSRFKRFLTPYKTSDMKIQNSPSRNRRKNRCHTWCVACVYYNSLAQTILTYSSCLGHQNKFHLK